LFSRVPLECQPVKRFDMGCPYETKTIRDWDELIELTKQFPPDRDRPWIFRGQGCAKWKLSSTLERAAFMRFQLSPDEVIKKEKGLLRRFKRQAYQYLHHLPEDTDLLEWLSLMQHYGAPTRLLDWTYSFYVAIYFAIEHANPGECCALWALDQKWVRDEARKRLAGSSRMKLDEDLNLKKPENVKSILFDPPSVPLVVSLNPLRLNERLVLQQGVFLAPGDVTKPFMENIGAVLDDNESHLIKAEIWCSKKFLEQGLQQLHRMNINRATLFPGLDGFAKHLEMLIPIPHALVVDEYWDGSWREEARQESWLSEANIMNHADEVREYCRIQYVEPARSRGETSITIRAGDVHAALNYKNRYPLVCSALGANAFEDLARVKRISIEGPLNGANTVFTFDLE
jgi:hypothetical protein